MRSTIGFFMSSADRPSSGISEHDAAQNTNVRSHKQRWQRTVDLLGVLLGVRRGVHGGLAAAATRVGAAACTTLAAAVARGRRDTTSCGLWRLLRGLFEVGLRETIANIKIQRNQPEEAAQCQTSSSAAARRPVARKRASERWTIDSIFTAKTRGMVRWFT
jgi:hypothetical protein